MADYKYFKTECILLIEPTTLTTPHDIAEAFSEYFSYVALHLHNQLPNTNINPNNYLEGDYPQSMVVPTLTSGDLSNIIKQNK